MELQEAEICPKCGKEFNCSKSGKCWCFEYQISSDVQYKMKDQYEGCLCPKCLSEFIQKNS